MGKTSFFLWLRKNNTTTFNVIHINLNSLYYETFNLHLSRGINLFWRWVYRKSVSSRLTQLMVSNPHKITTHPTRLGVSYRMGNYLSVYGAIFWINLEQTLGKPIGTRLDIYIAADIELCVEFYVFLSPQSVKRIYQHSIA